MPHRTSNEHPQLPLSSPLLGNRLGIGQRKVNNCVAHHLFILFIVTGTFFFPFFSFLLSQTTSLSFFFSIPLNSLIPLQGGEQTAVPCLPACWVIPQQTPSSVEKTCRKIYNRQIHSAEHSPILQNITRASAEFCIWDRVILGIHTDQGMRGWQAAPRKAMWEFWLMTR